jgi:hypothetical protein
MNWKLKALVQKAVAALPGPLSHKTYYWLQRHFGDLKHVNPAHLFDDAIEVRDIAEKLQRSFAGGVLFELGTGPRPNMPLLYWLLGAKEIITLDLNPQLKEELVREDLDYVRRNQVQVREKLAGRVCGDRFERLMALAETNWRLAHLLELCNITYLAPADARKLPLAADSIDFYTSHNVLQHVSADLLKPIFEEANRVTKRQGLFIHAIDYTDQFAMSDRSISLIHFLQFDDDRWHKIAGNRYAYVNRLRDDDFQELARSVHQRLLLCEPYIDPALRELLTKGSVKLADAFAKKSEDVLATTRSWMVSEKCN